MNKVFLAVLVFSALSASFAAEVEVFRQHKSTKYVYLSAYPDSSIHHTDGHLDLIDTQSVSPKEERVCSQIEARPGLNGKKNTVSLLLHTDHTYFQERPDGQIWAQHYDGSKLGADRATFRIVEALNHDKSGQSLESSSRPGYFIRGHHGAFILSKNDGSKSFAEQSSFFIYKGKFSDSLDHKAVRNVRRLKKAFRSLKSQSTHSPAVGLDAHRVDMMTQAKLNEIKYLLSQQPGSGSPMQIELRRMARKHLSAAIASASLAVASQQGAIKAKKVPGAFEKSEAEARVNDFHKAVVDVQKAKKAVRDAKKSGDEEAVEQAKRALNAAKEARHDARVAAIDAQKAHTEVVMSTKKTVTKPRKDEKSFNAQIRKISLDSTQKAVQQNDKKRLAAEQAAADAAQDRQAAAKKAAEAAAAKKADAEAAHQAAKKRAKAADEALKAARIKVMAIVKMTHATGATEESRAAAKKAKLALEAAEKRLNERRLAEIAAAKKIAAAIKKAAASAAAAKNAANAAKLSQTKVDQHESLLDARQAALDKIAADKKFKDAQMLSNMKAAFVAKMALEFKRAKEANAKAAALAGSFAAKIKAAVAAAAAAQRRAEETAAEKERRDAIVAKERERSAKKVAALIKARDAHLKKIAAGAIAAMAQKAAAVAAKAKAAAAAAAAELARQEAKVILAARQAARNAKEKKQADAEVQKRTLALAMAAKEAKDKKVAVEQAESTVKKEAKKETRFKDAITAAHEAHVHAKAEAMTNPQDSKAAEKAMMAAIAHKQAVAAMAAHKKHMDELKDKAEAAIKAALGKKAREEEMRAKLTAEKARALNVAKAEKKAAALAKASKVAAAAAKAKALAAEKVRKAAADTAASEAAEARRKKEQEDKARAAAATIIAKAQEALKKAKAAAAAASSAAAKAATAQRLREAQEAQKRADAEKAASAAKAAAAKAAADAERVEKAKADQDKAFRAEQEKKRAAAAAAAAAKDAIKQTVSVGVVHPPRVFQVPSSGAQVKANILAQQEFKAMSGQVRIVKYITAPGNNANYIKFGKMVDATSGFEMQFSAKGSNDVHIAFFTAQVPRSTDAWEVVLGGWGNSRSVIRSGTQGIELTSVQSSSSVGPADTWRYFWLSYDADSHMLSVWDDTGAYHDAPLMSTKMPALSANKLYPAFGAWDSPVQFKAPIYVDMLEYDHYIETKDAGAQHVETNHATDLIELDAF